MFLKKVMLGAIIYNVLIVKPNIYVFYDDAKIEGWQNLRTVTNDVSLQHKLKMQIIDRMQMLKNKYGG